MNPINGGGSSPFQMSLIDVIFPGFGMVTASARQLLAGDPDSYTRLLCTFGMFILFARYAVRYVWEIVRSYFSPYTSCYCRVGLTIWSIDNLCLILRRSIRYTCWLDSRPTICPQCPLIDCSRKISTAGKQPMFDKEKAVDLFSLGWIFFVLV